MPPTDPAVVLESVRYKLMIKQQGKAVRAPALALVVGTGRCVLDAQCPCTKSSPALWRETNWPGAACGGHLSPLPWFKQMLSGHCELLLLQISSPSLPGTFSLDLGLHLSNTHSCHFTRCQMPAQALKNQCPCRVFIYLIASRLKLLVTCLSLLHKGQATLTLHLWLTKASSKLASLPPALSPLCHMKSLQPFELDGWNCQLITAKVWAQQAPAGRMQVPRGRRNAVVPLRSRHWVQFTRETRQRTQTGFYSLVDTKSFPHPGVDPKAPTPCEGRVPPRMGAWRCLQAALFRGFPW